MFVISSPFHTKWRFLEQFQWDCCLYTHGTFLSNYRATAGTSRCPQRPMLCWHKTTSTTTSHRYLDCIIGPPTHAVYPRYCDRDVYTSQTLDLVHCGTVWVITSRSTGVWCWSGKTACMFTVCFPAAPVVRPLTGSDGGWRGWTCTQSVLTLLPAGLKHIRKASARNGAAMWPGQQLVQSFCLRMMRTAFRHFLQISGVSTCEQKLCNSAEQ